MRHLDGHPSTAEILDIQMSRLLSIVAAICGTKMSPKEFSLLNPPAEMTEEEEATVWAGLIKNANEH